MHHALKVDYIVYEILQHVKPSKSDLLNMAMTCSTFSSIALDMLWCQQDNLTPLGEIFSREPLLPEWERVRINAARIRKFTVTQYTDRFPKLSGPVLRQLFTLFPPAMLFPRLCTLDFKAVSLDSLDVASDYLWLLRQFSSPGLKRLVFNIPRGVSRPELEQFLGGLSTDVSSLQHLAIHQPNPHVPECRYIVPKLPEKLNGLVIGPIPMNLMRQNIANIQHLRCLQSLELDLEGLNNMETQPSGDMSLELSTLKCLKLSGARLEFCVSFLDHIAMPRLSVIKISYYRAGAKPAEITAVFKSICTACKTFAFLKEITVVDSSPHIMNILGPEDELHSSIFRPLLQFQGLTSVRFSKIGKYHLDDAFIEDLAVAWPDLRALRFASLAILDDHRHVTLTAMLSLATRCKLLQDLHITFDATHFPTLPRAPDGNTELWTTQTALRQLNIGCSKVSDASHLHLLLAVLFPNLVDLQYNPQFSYGSVYLAWKKFQTAWRGLQIQRKNSPDEAASWSNTLMQLQPRLEDANNLL
ncbi:uncharacterized protein EDB93DRAFT_1295301 [Suillus bovinus]|uniref:uncharacterized protein n=1 Tax=Suillus bovinus TaxID=48563 RepID=UPI001B886A8C|nr:uncharacterized protein EDB93DRAFT_1295301 [Suillus bovinus]KAG2140956.1 hypothetical protein EDB93DRAFT_1295301 [Suillus bovinus]